MEEMIRSTRQAGLGCRPPIRNKPAIDVRCAFCRFDKAEVDSGRGYGRPINGFLKMRNVDSTQEGIARRIGRIHALF